MKNCSVSKQKHNRVCKTVPLLLAALVMCMGALCGCNNSAADRHINNGVANDANTLSVVTTVFPAYDIARSVAGSRASVVQLLRPGTESHSFEPTPQDMALIKNCDVFIYAGGESDTWIENIMDSVDMSSKTVISMLDSVDALEEEEVEGMSEGGVLAEYISEEEEEADEHVWTSPKNMIRIASAVTDAMAAADPDGSDLYHENGNAYIDELSVLDDDYRKTLDAASSHTIVVADRFPFRYLCEEYNLTYYAAFPGCSEDAEITADSIITLCDKVTQANLDTVFHIEFSNEKIADSICEVTGAKKRLLHSCHNVSAKETEEGVTYISLMRNNLETLKEALK